MITEKIKECIKDSRLYNTSPSKKTNFLSKFGDINDNHKIGITKINTAINNNPFNIILLDKKNNRNYIKKPSFPNISVSYSIMNEKEDKKEIKSENNIDESRETLHNKLNGLFTEEKKKIYPNNIKLNILSTKKSMDNINNTNSKKKYINKYFNNIINKSKCNTKYNNKEEDLSESKINENINVNDLMNKCNLVNKNKKIGEEINPNFKLKLKNSHSFTSLPLKRETLEKRNEANDNDNVKKLNKKNSIISHDYNINKSSIFSSLNDVMKTVNDDNKNKNKEYNFYNNKENKRYGMVR